MNDSQEIWNLLRPVLKGWYIFVITTAISLTLGIKSVQKSVPEYQAKATLKINDKETGGGGLLKNFEIFSTTGQLLTEIEVLKSRYLIRKVLNKLDFDICYYRHAKEVDYELYHRSPFEVNYCFENEKWVNKIFRFTYYPDETFILSYGSKEVPLRIRGMLGVPVKTDEFTFTINRAAPLPGEKLNPFPPGEYAFEVFDEERLLAQYAGKALHIKLLDKEISIVKLYFNHKVPKKAQIFLNTLSETYVQDFIDSKTEAAAKALVFIDRELAKVSKDLEQSELELANFQKAHKLVDLRMEKDAELKKVSQIELQKLNAELEGVQLRKVLTYLHDSIDSEHFVPDLGSVQDPYFQTGISKIRDLRTLRQEKLLKYTPNHPSVQQIIALEDTVKRNLLESINHALETNRATLSELQKPLTAAEIKFRQLPEIERELIVLTRRFQLYEKAYGQLMSKKTEAQIGAAATIAFHKILETANEPTEPINSMKKIVIAVAAFLGLAIGFVIVFLQSYMKASFYSPKSLTDNLEMPMAGSIGNVNISAQNIHVDIINMAMNLKLLYEPQLMVMVSAEAKAGKTFISYQLARAFAAMNIRTLLVDANMYRPQIHEIFDLPGEIGLAQMVENDEPLEACVQATSYPSLEVLPAGNCKLIPAGILLDPRFPRVLEDCKAKYDVVFIDTPEMQSTHDCLVLVPHCDLTLVIARTGQTKLTQLVALEEELARFNAQRATAILNYSSSGRKEGRIGKFKADGTLEKKRKREVIIDLFPKRWHKPMKQLLFLNR